MGSEILVLKYIGEDDWSIPVYQDQFEHLWKDISCGMFGEPDLCSVVGNDFEGEPNKSINQKFVIEPIENKISDEKRFQYQMLGRLKSDCDYYLGYGYRYSGHLWAKDEKEQINEMKKLWLAFAEEEKPEWLTWEQILEYKSKMCDN